jgi:hypothetical protein
MEEEVLNDLTHTLHTRVVRLAVSKLISALSSILPDAIDAIGSTSAPIALSRNLALLVAVGLKIKQACFIDDDITRFSETQPYREFLTGSTAQFKNRVNGVHIIGVDSRDHMTRLSTAFYNLATLRKAAEKISREQLICVKAHSSESPISFQTGDEKRVDHVSGGFTCCFLDFDKVLPFPAVYNEFWIWCFLQSCIHHTEVMLSRSWVMHKHPLAPAVTLESIVEEQMGIFFYKLLRGVRRQLASISDLLGPPIVPEGLNAFSPYVRVRKILSSLRAADIDNLGKACAILGLDSEELEAKLLGYLVSIDPKETAERLWRAYAEQIRSFSSAVVILKNSQAVMEDICLASIS